jgi:ribosomal protein L11 methyltransferase
MYYLAIHCHITPKEPFADVIIAEMADAGFSMFEDTDNGFVAYMETEILDDMYLASIIRTDSNELYTAKFTYEIIPYKNWNEEWEKNFEPLDIKDVYVRAPFHPAKPESKFELIIQPKMSFGTGHHATTSLMIEQMLDLDFKNKSVCDMGCGSGILAILAGKLGATEITAIDIDAHCIENTMENCEVNKINKVKTFKGDAHTLFESGSYDILIANINRNIILSDVKIYAACLHKNGTLLLSGFYEEDVPAILQEAEKHHLKFVEKKTKDKWCLLMLNKIM